MSINAVSSYVLKQKQLRPVLLTTTSRITWRNQKNNGPIIIILGKQLRSIFLLLA